jgi:hypothetical protein
MKAFNVECPLSIDEYWPEELAALIEYKTNQLIIVTENRRV